MYFGNIVYGKTARESHGKRKLVYAFGRHSDFKGKPASDGGYAVLVRRANYSQNKGGLAWSWRVVEERLPIQDAIELMNKRLHKKVWEDVEKPRKEKKWK